MEENDNLPKKLCDSCIIQLNVAYSLKKSAVQSDIRLRQYIIENGLLPIQGTTCINNISIVRPTEIILPNRIENPIQAIHSTSADRQQKHVNPIQSEPPSVRFPLIPLMIKEEPIDYEEIMSDITVDTENGVDTQSNRSSSTNNITPINGRRKDTPLPPNLMVAVNPTFFNDAENSDDDYLNSLQKTPQSTNRSINNKKKSQNSPIVRTSPRTNNVSTQSATTSESSPSCRQVPGTMISKNNKTSKYSTTQKKLTFSVNELKRLQVVMTEKFSAKILEDSSRRITRKSNADQSQIENDKRRKTSFTASPKSKKQKIQNTKLHFQKPTRISV